MSAWPLSELPSAEDPSLSLFNGLPRVSADRVRVSRRTPAPSSFLVICPSRPSEIFPRSTRLPLWDSHDTLSEGIPTATSSFGSRQPRPKRSVNSWISFLFAEDAPEGQSAVAAEIVATPSSSKALSSRRDGRGVVISKSSSHNFETDSMIWKPGGFKQHSFVSVVGLPSSFNFANAHGGHGSASNIVHTAVDVAKHADDPDRWLHLVTETSAWLNWVAMLLSFCTAIYHVYGYVQYKTVLDQQENVNDEAD
eukprot:TRINITY_DN64353_c0_g1_i1.p1 TRINITY_DN64353_c0_g1~~TRINITY_DN64353_c0_g1_i1.p1  ORF type:complete len:271 (-),score=20.67 TRINITY_DN64353_c0_g1_i1:24-779(-)